MVYRLKKFQYKGNDRHILLQNENGPCPLLAAANALMLKGSCSLPSASVRNDVASLEDVSNMLANQAMQSTDQEYYIDELVQHIPKFQFGMDVNPKFTEGIMGYEYTSQLTAFDMLRCNLVHGWLVDPEQRETHAVLRNKTYNEIVMKIIHGKEAETQFEQVSADVMKLSRPVDLLDDGPPSDPRTQQRLVKLQTKQTELETAATQGHVLDDFLAATGHQLTHYGLYQLHEHVKEDELCVFFRNNHFNTLTKHQGLLYLLVTDLGYANSPAICWEKLDMINGDTEYVNAHFVASGRQDAMLAERPTMTPEEVSAVSDQTKRDTMVANHLSKGGTVESLDEKESKILRAVEEASLLDFNNVPSSTPTAPRTPTMVVGVPAAAPPTITEATVERAPRPSPPGRYAGDLAQEEVDRQLAMQLQEHGDESLQLAKQLQNEENRRAAPTRRQRPAASTNGSSRNGNCIIL